MAATGTSNSGACCSPLLLSPSCSPAAGDDGSGAGDFFRPMIFDDTGLLRAASPGEAAGAFGCAFSMSLSLVPTRGAAEPAAEPMQPLPPLPPPPPATSTKAMKAATTTTTTTLHHHLHHLSSPSTSSTPLRPSTPSPTTSAAAAAGSGLPSSRAGGPCNHCGTTGERERSKIGWKEKKRSEEALELS